MTTPANVTVRRDVAVPMRDGARLLADIYELGDAATGPWPALVHRTAYGRTNRAMIVELVADPEALAAAGYVVVVQDVRGRSGSEGEWRPFVHERDDGYDTVEWIAAQAWCNGRVGIYGSSYMGITTYAAVAAQPPHLQAAAALVAGCRPQHGLVRTGGTVEFGFLAFWNLTNVFDTLEHAPDLEPATRADAAARLAAAVADPWPVVSARPALDASALELTPLLRWQIEHEPDDALWRSIDLAASDVAVPLLSIVGFRDWMAPSMLELFGEIQPDSRHRLIAGPWTHRSAYGGPTGERDLTAVAPGGPTAHAPELLAWFDHWLCDAPDSSAPVRWFATGANRWQDGPSWPPPDAKRATLYLTVRSDGAVGDERPADSASAGLAASTGIDGELAWTHDPADPVPTTGGIACMPLLSPDGIVDRRAVEARPDVVVCTGAELVDPLEIAGPVTARLWLAADVADTDVVVGLVDVEPDGAAVPVTEGVLRTRYREGGHDAWLEPGRPTELAVELAQAAHVFAPGHRVRVEIASSNFPRFVAHPGDTAQPELTPADRYRVAHLRVQVGAEHPSRIEFTAR